MPDLNKMANPLPDSWLLEQITLSLFHHFGPHTAEISDHRVSFLPQAAFDKNKPLELLFAAGVAQLSPGRFNDLLLILLAGEFYSLDQFRLKGISVHNTGIDIELQYIRVESADGEPFQTDSYLLIPLNASIIAHQRLTIKFEAIEKDFAGQEQPAQHIQIAPFEIRFNVQPS
jgi:hypothetical protein